MDTTLMNEKNQRVVTFLNREELDFLDKLGKDALFSTGVKISRAKLIAWMVDLAKELNINGKDLASKTDFEKRIFQGLQKSFTTVQQETKPPATEGS